MALLTGLYGTEVGITDYLTPEEGVDGIGLPASALTWPRVLQQIGFRTALFGKYQLVAMGFDPANRIIHHDVRPRAFDVGHPHIDRETRAQLQQRLNERMKEINDPLMTGR